MRTIDIHRRGEGSAQRLEPGPQGGEDLLAPG
jgi:hypothetical protein